MIDWVTGAGFRPLNVSRCSPFVSKCPRIVAKPPKASTDHRRTLLWLIRFSHVRGRSEQSKTKADDIGRRAR